MNTSKYIIPGSQYMGLFVPMPSFILDEDEEIIGINFVSTLSIGRIPVGLLCNIPLILWIIFK